MLKYSRQLGFNDRFRGYSHRVPALYSSKMEEIILKVKIFLQAQARKFPQPQSQNYIEIA